VHAALAALVLVTGTAGVSARIPAGWHRVPAALTPCTNPVERLDVAGPGGALVMVQEALDRAYVDRFPRRSRHFGVRGPAGYLTCCDAPGHGKGWFLSFRDGGRSFYVYLYPGKSRNPSIALAILDSLRIRARSASA
jgi:hypothetical protein